MRFVPTVLKQIDSTFDAAEEAQKAIAEGKADAETISKLEKALKSDGQGLAVLRMSPEFDETRVKLLESLQKCKKIRKHGCIQTPGESEAREAYMSLTRNHGLYETQTRLWHREAETSQHYSSPKTASAQLLGVIARSFIGDKMDAAGIYDRLIETELYDKRKKQWNSSIDSDGRESNNSRTSYDQLLGVIALCSLDRFKDAESSYNRLTGRTVLCDIKTGQWQGFIGKNQGIMSTERYALSQLFGVTALAYIGMKDEAAKFYDSLLKTSLYDAGKSQWNEVMDENGKAISSNRSSATQLAGVIALSSMERQEEAIRRYNQLLETKLYDRENDLWNLYLRHDQTLGANSILSSSQLLGVIALACAGGQ